MLDENDSLSSMGSVKQIEDIQLPENEDKSNWTLRHQCQNQPDKPTVLLKSQKCTTEKAKSMWQAHC